MRTIFHFTCHPPDALICLTGDVDLVSRDRLLEVLHRVRARDCREVALDLADVTFIDAHSLRILDDERRRLEAFGGALRVVAASDACLLVTALAGYDRLSPSADAPSGPRRRRVAFRTRLPSGTRMG